MTQEYPRAWLTSALHPLLWGNAAGTYAWIAIERLPALSVEAGWAWLPALAGEDDEGLGYAEWEHSHDDGAHEHDHEGDQVHTHDGEHDVLHHLALAREQADERGVVLPEDFVAFVTSRDVMARVPTNTACHVDLSAGLLPAPEGDGWLLRFLNDQQATALWYLHLRVGRPAVVIAAGAELVDTDAATLDGAIRPVEPHECAASFSEFVKRFWLENRIWYALTYERALTDEEQRYLAWAQRFSQS